MNCKFTIRVWFESKAHLNVSQDTNYTQYELMTALALHKCVTIVGDPDQSSECNQFKGVMAFLK